MITFQDALTIISREIQAIEYSQSPSGLCDPVAYLLALKGKKIRPALTLLACNLYAEDVTEAVYPALAWEIFHNFTLMHDDVMDKANLRRGQLTVHKKWDENTAILSGDFMLILAYQYMAKSPPEVMKALLDLFSETAVGICSGQQYDMEFEKRLDVTENEYINMIRLKTAVMLGACLESGAIAGGAGIDDRKKLYAFGINLGIAFQIKDDLLDVFGNANTFGKKIGGDILCNKKTYLLVNALNSENEKVKRDLIQWIRCDDRPEEKIEAVRNLYNNLSIEEKALETIRVFYRKAVDALQSVSVSTERKGVLMHFAENLMEREY
jgi:geranylgeranyl diphosphate synthase type II